MLAIAASFSLAVPIREHVGAYRLDAEHPSNTETNTKPLPEPPTNLTSLMGTCQKAGDIPPLCLENLYGRKSYYPTGPQLKFMEAAPAQKLLEERSTAVRKYLCSLPTEEAPHYQYAYSKTYSKIYYYWAESTLVSAKLNGTRPKLQDDYFATKMMQTFRSSSEKLPETLGGAAHTPEGGCKSADGSFDKWQPIDFCTPLGNTTPVAGAETFDLIMGSLGGDPLNAVDADLVSWEQTQAKAGHHLRERLIGGYEKLHFVTVQELWYDAQMVRLAMDSWGSCARAASDYLMGQALTITPKGEHISAANFMFEPAKMIGMHIRRGDACHQWADKESPESGVAKPRPCFKTHLYMAEARKMKQMYNVTRVAVATDSDLVITELANYSHEFEFIYLPFNRTLVGGTDTSTKELHGDFDEGANIENRDDLFNSEDTKALVFASASAETRLLSQASYMIGTASSTVSRMVFMLQLGRMGYVPPHYFFDRPMVCAGGAFCAVGIDCGCYNDGFSDGEFEGRF